MNLPRQKLVSGALVVATLCLAVVLSSHAQTVSTSSPAVSSSTSQASLDAQRAKIWNSSNMLRARAWLQDYCSTSAKVTPAEAKAYQAELESMTPVQMKLWLLKFDEEEDAKQQQQALWKHAHSAALTQAMAADRNTNKSNAAINSEESQAAGEEEQQINEETQNEQNNESDKQIEEGAYGPGAGGGIHYHFHLSPY